jgi:hypothetical protein
VFPLNFKPDLIMLPFKAAIRETGQPLTLEQARSLIALGESQFVQVERSYPGMPEALGWTIFERKTHAYVHTGDPLFDTEREARRYMRTAYTIWHDLNGPEATTYSHAHR